jgi:pimeloyl-ACP methyl ester carboxylesterase
MIFALAACGGTASHSATSAPSAPPAETFAPTSFSVRVSGTGRPVVFIPGLTCDGSVWDPTLSHLGGKVQAHVLSLAGFGGRAAITAPLLPTVREELARYLRARRLARPILVGHSLGAFLSFWLAATEPDLVAGVVAVDGAPFFPGLGDPTATPARAAEPAGQLRAQIGATPPERLGATMRPFFARMITRPEDLEQLMATSSRSDPRTTADAMYFLMTTDLRAQIAAIRAPVLVLAADDGELPREQLARAWEAQIAAVPHHELQLIEGARHFLMYDQPAAFYAALDGFLAAHQ